jgi:hypothetical protein
LKLIDDDLYIKEKELKDMQIKRLDKTGFFNNLKNNYDEKVFFFLFF